MTYKSIAILILALVPGLSHAQQTSSPKALCQSVSRHPTVFQSCIKIVQQGRATNAMIERQIRDRQNAVAQAALKRDQQRQKALKLQQQQIYQQSQTTKQVRPALVNPTPAYQAPRITPPQIRPAATPIAPDSALKKPRSTQPSGFHIQYD
jgi:TolA-binding protein